MKTVRFRFYEELNDFLPQAKRKKDFIHNFSGRVSVKDMIESLGVPHIEVDLILVNGKSVNFNYIVCENDSISVYPVFESFDISSVQNLRPKPLRDNKFIADFHLGKLSRYLRMFGFDVLLMQKPDNKLIVEISLSQKRTILTKSVDLLKRNDVTHGYWIRSIDLSDQVIEVINRFQLRNEINEFSRCLDCNKLLTEVDKEKIWDRIPSTVEQNRNEFKRCDNCSKLFWKGTHFTKMKKFMEEIKQRI